VDVLFEVRAREAGCDDLTDELVVTGHAATITTLSYAIRFWSKGTKRAVFLRHEGFLWVASILWLAPNANAVDTEGLLVLGLKTLIRKRSK
jgi:hypothetical protein